MTQETCFLFRGSFLPIDAKFFYGNSSVSEVFFCGNTLDTEQQASTGLVSYERWKGAEIPPTMEFLHLPPVLSHCHLDQWALMEFFYKEKMG
jgi:hypothetical protein